MSPRSQEKHPHLLPWYAAGTLEAAAAEEIRCHLDGCPECRHVVETMSEVAVSLGTDASPAHVDAEALIQYEAAGTGELSEIHQHVEAHLIRCDACRQDLARLRLVRRSEVARKEKSPELSGAHSAATTRRAMARIRWPAIAAAAATVLIVFAFVTQNREPLPLSQELVFTPRSRASAARPELRAPGPWSIRVVLPYKASRGSYRARIENESGDVMRAMDGPFTATAEGNLVLPIPNLGNPGTYNLIVEPLGAPAAESCRYWFTIVRATESG